MENKGCNNNNASSEPNAFESSAMMLVNAFQKTGARMNAATATAHEKTMDEAAATSSQRSTTTRAHSIPEIVFIKPNRRRSSSNKQSNNKKKHKVSNKQEQHNTNHHTNTTNSKRHQTRNGNYYYNKIIQHMSAAAAQRKQHALTISTPTTTLEEDALIESGQVSSIDELVCNFSKERIESEFTWIYVNSNWEDVFGWYYKVFAQCDDGGLYLVTSRRGNADSLPIRQRIAWTVETANIMHMCIHRFFALNDDMWKRTQKSKPSTSRGRSLRRDAFTHLMAITQTIYHIDHWHNNTDEPEDLMDIAKIVTDRWRITTRRDHESIGLDENGRKGLEMFMSQVEDNWKKSESNVFLKGRFQFRWK